MHQYTYLAPSSGVDPQTISSQYNWFFRLLVEVRGFTPTLLATPAMAARVATDLATVTSNHARLLTNTFTARVTPKPNASVSIDAGGSATVTVWEVVISGYFSVEGTDTVDWNLVARGLARGLYNGMTLTPSGGQGAQPARPEHGGNIVVRAQEHNQRPLDAFASAQLDTSSIPKTGEQTPATPPVALGTPAQPVGTGSGTGGRAPGGGTGPGVAQGGCRVRSPEGFYLRGEITASRAGADYYAKNTWIRILQRFQPSVSGSDFYYIEVEPENRRAGRSYGGYILLKSGSVRCASITTYHHDLSVAGGGGGGGGGGTTGGGGGTTGGGTGGDLTPDWEAPVGSTTPWKTIAVVGAVGLAGVVGGILLLRRDTKDLEGPPGRRTLPMPEPMLQGATRSNPDVQAEIDAIRRDLERDLPGVMGNPAATAKDTDAEARWRHVCAWTEAQREATARDTEAEARWREVCGWSEEARRGQKRDLPGVVRNPAATTGDNVVRILWCPAHNAWRAWTTMAGSGAGHELLASGAHASDNELRQEAQQMLRRSGYDPSKFSILVHRGTGS